MPFGITAQQLLVGVGLFVLSLLVTSAIAVAFLIHIQADHFIAPPRSRHSGRPWLVRMLLFGGKNLLGVVLILVGIALSLPGVPGQGLLTILVGLLLLDVPGKQALELRIVRRPRILRAVNAIRQRFGRPVLVIDEGDAAEALR